MARSSPITNRSGRIAAAILLALACILFVAATRIDYAFSSDPLGPRAIPLILAAALGLFALRYGFSPGPAEVFPRGPLLLRSIGFVAVCFATVALLDLLGFLPAMAVLIGVTALLFGATPLQAAVVGVVQAAFWFVCFKYALGTYLPMGSIFTAG
ncbi:tripartite tricarboxylate transporter TctB family protein [Chelatococcus sp. SYSU_G07232]|uniref:Tripartite tricarboxylate transporter TctB family protein n=1 Tax=Chelatococcus albus TaxID=3047466 RepID=A0ABT7ABT4_9HYPH|nr:tripartite tricarboxylate transporter TctB family protein [Chelatococcus sp. SYSU_G07232]MDJ1156808.1 tripartite tricarboxylate transporter TctB family protein [Chelatococcus sp. SYSU_G07232]